VQAVLKSSIETDPGGDTATFLLAGKVAVLETSIVWERAFPAVKINVNNAKNCRRLFCLLCFFLVYLAFFACIAGIY